MTPRTNWVRLLAQWVDSLGVGNYQASIWKGGWSCKSSWQCTFELIKKIWNIALDMWENWNRVLHNSPQTQQQIVESKINDQIRVYYARVPQALPWDAMHFMAQSAKHQLLVLPLVTEQQWLESVQLTIAQKTNTILVIICPCNNPCKGGLLYDDCLTGKKWIHAYLHISSYRQVNDRWIRQAGLTHLV